jgi:hypothetical protein
MVLQFVGCLQHEVEDILAPWFQNYILLVLVWGKRRGMLNHTTRTYFLINDIIIHRILWLFVNQVSQSLFTCSQLNILNSSKSFYKRRILNWRLNFLLSKLQSTISFIIVIKTLIVMILHLICTYHEYVVQTTILFQESMWHIL